MKPRSIQQAHTRAPDPKLEAVLARLCERLGGKIWKTQAVKLPYVVDLVGMHVLGQKITETRHEAWNMGVVATGAWTLMRHQRGGEHFTIESAEYSEDAHQLVLKSRPPAVLSDEEEEIVDFVASEYGSWPLERLMALTKKVNPGVDTWGGPPSQEIVEEEAAYRRLPVWFGEDEADAEIARRALREMREDPSTVLRGEEVEDFLRELAG